jgi:hypothetical protein
VYALSETGRNRFAEFPRVTADDGYVRIQFRSEERETVAAVYSTVFPPQTMSGLIATKTRSHYGSFELAREFPELWKNRGESNQKSLLGLFKKPSLWPSIAVYTAIMTMAKYRARKRLRTASMVWERDNTSRVAGRPQTSGGL